MATIFRRLLHLVRWSRHDADLREEIATHRARSGRTRCSAMDWGQRRPRGPVVEPWATSRSPSKRPATRGRRGCSTPSSRMCGLPSAGCARARVLGRHPSARSHSGSAPIRRSSRSSTASSFARCPSASRAASRCSLMDRGRIRSGRRSTHARQACSTARSPGRGGLQPDGGRSHHFCRRRIRQRPLLRPARRKHGAGRGSSRHRAAGFSARWRPHPCGAGPWRGRQLVGGTVRRAVALRGAGEGSDDVRSCRGRAAGCRGRGGVGACTPRRAARPGDRTAVRTE